HLSRSRLQLFSAAPEKIHECSKRCREPRRDGRGNLAALRILGAHGRWQLYHRSAATADPTLRRRRACGHGGLHARHSLRPNQIDRKISHRTLMTPEIVGLIGIVAMLALLGLKVPVGI